MTNTKLRAALMVGAATAAALSISASARADSTVETVVVTGSRIPVQQGLTSSSPITTVDQTELKLEGTRNVEDALNSLPSVFVDQNSAQNNGVTGSATVDLRGLGAARTLVLVDGTRLMPGDPQEPVADLNNIPASLVDHIEVLTGGAGAVYGSDAVSGVVNFIMRKDFEGVELNGQFGIAENANDNALVRAAQTSASQPLAPEGRWDGENVDSSILLGANSPDGKGNITAYLAFHSQRAIFWNARDYGACTLGLNGAGHYSCSGSSNKNRFISIDNATASVSPYDFYQTGSGVSGSHSGVLSPYAGGPAETFNYGALNYLQRPDQRYNGGFFAHYDVNSHLNFYGSMMFTDDHTTQVAAPTAVFLGVGTVFGAFQQVNCGNPLMSAQENQLLCGILPGDSLVTSPGGHTYYGGQANITPGESTLEIGRRLNEIGDRFTEQGHEAYRFQVGAKGDIADGWTYDVYAQYGLSRYTNILRGDISKEKVQNALNVDPDTGACISTDPGCVPLDIFDGLGSVTPAQLAYIGVNGIFLGYTKEQIVSGSVTGDLGAWGGKSPWSKNPIAVSFGAEYRSEQLQLDSDREYATNDLYGTGGATTPQPKAGFDVEEGFGEIRIPIAEDLPFIETLTAHGGYRYSSYSSAGIAESYEYGLDWQPVDDIRVRASLQHAVRAPNVNELFAPQNNVLFSGDDPCATSTTGQCAAVPHAGTALLSCPAQQCNNLVGGNPTLKPETSYTRSFGFVVTPTFVPGLSLTMDYFDIKLNGAIGGIAATTTLQNCYGSTATAATEAFFCPLVHRNAIGQIYGSGFITATNNNLGYLQTSGVDFGANYSVDLSDWDMPASGSLSFDFVGTYLQSLVTQSYVGAIPFDCKGYYGATCGASNPDWRHKLRVTWTSPWDVSLSLDWRYFGGVTDDVNSPNPNLAGTPDHNPLTSHIADYNWIDLATTWTVMEGFELRAGVNNVFDKDPPILTSTLTPLPVGNANTFPGTYDYLGRQFFLSGTVKF